MHTILKYIFTFIIICTSILSAQNVVEWNGFQFDLSRMVADQDSFVMIQDNKEIGRWVWKTEILDDKVVFTDISIVDGKVWEDAILKMDKDLSKFEIDLKMIIGNNSLQNNSTIRNDKLKGKFSQTVKKSTKFYDLEEDFSDKNIIPRAVFLGLLPSVINKSDFVKGLNFYSSISSEIWPVNFSIKDETEITIAAGKFKVIPMVILKAGEKGVSNIFYIEKDFPHRTIKVDVIEQKMSIELVSTK